MAKAKSVYRCSDCGFESAKWAGQCPDCSAWNTLVEETRAAAAAERRPATQLTDFTSEVTPLEKAAAADLKRIPTGIGEVERLLGGGVVAGQVLLLAGPPGIGKS